MAQIGFRGRVERAADNLAIAIDVPRPELVHSRNKPLSLPYLQGSRRVETTSESRDIKLALDQGSSSQSSLHSSTNLKSFRRIIFALAGHPDWSLALGHHHPASRLSTTSVPGGALKS